MPSRSVDSFGFFGVPVDEFSRAEVLGRIASALETGERLRIATVNPEYLVEARRNARFRESLRSADLRIADGAGVALLARLFGRRLERIPGADLALASIELAVSRGRPVFLAVREDGLTSYAEAARILSKRYPGIDHRRLDAGTTVPPSSLVLCNYGAPLQEFMLDQLSGGGVRIGIGGTLEYLSGKLRRAPRFLRSVGLEWLWRLVLQPRRFRRIVHAVIVFPILAIFDTIRR